MTFDAKGNRTGIVCSFLCLGTAGRACLACLAAAAGGFAAIVEFCIEMSL